ncbi:MAG: octanoyltransferase [Bacteroidota bacterium]|jgi:lipoyl(octanoyl) transferase
MDFNIKKIGLSRYADALEMQNQTHKLVSNGGKATIILCEHPHVYTFGKSADKNNLLVNPDFLKQISAEVFETERGGDITYHGPGQLVGYPIINLRALGIGVKKYVESLEQSLISALADFNISAYQMEGLTGIWVGKDNEMKRKIGAIGIRVKNGVSMHGFALNVNTDLSYFNHIVPCGITDKDVTSIAKENGSGDLDAFSARFVYHFTIQMQKEVVL